jgi:hypothetical protein
MSFLKDIKIKLHPLEIKLIESLRNIGDGTIDRIKVQDGLPVIYNVIFDGMEIFPG